MKKTLIALAVLAASGASFAQVAITGSVAFGYEADHNGTNKSDASGLGNDTSYLQFTATEDIGGGLKATAIMAIDGLTRGGASGGDSSIALAGGFGTLTLSATKGADYLSGGLAKVGGNGFDGKVFSARSLADGISYAVPVGPVTVSLSHSESGNAVGLGGGSAGNVQTYTTTNANGVPSTSEYQRTNRIAAKYTAGALVVDGGYAVYDQQGTAGGNDKSQVRAAVTYDLGVAKIGGGLVSNTKVVGTRNDYLVSVSAPFGALTLGADYASRTTNDYAASTTGLVTNGTTTGYGLSADYALSKRTAVGVYYTNWKGNLNDTENSSYTAVLLSHSF